VVLRSNDGRRRAFYRYEGSIEGDTRLAQAVESALTFGESMGFLFDDDELEKGGTGARARAWKLARELAGLEAGGGGRPKSATTATDSLPDLEPSAVTQAPVGETEELLGDALELFDELPAPQAQAAPDFGGDATQVLGCGEPSLDDATQLASPHDFLDEPEASEPDPKPLQPAPAPLDAESALEPARVRQRAKALAAPESAPTGVSAEVSLTKFRRKAELPASPPVEEAKAPTGAVPLGRVQLVRRRRRERGSANPLLRILGAF
jgi:hypothetical protein